MRLALRWPLLCACLGIAAALAGSFVPYERVAAEGHPWLPRYQCPGCALCGMTRSFCALSAGRPEAAARHNPLGPPAYAGFWAWTLIVTPLTLRSLRASSRRLQSPRARRA